MAGIYIHIPFCKQRCYYCDFHSSTEIQNKKELVNAILQEITLEKNYLAKKNIETIYFGGGTPSLLSSNEIQSLINKIGDNHTVVPNCEITLECNPDDLSIEYINSLKATSINRLSIGIQSFDDEQLQVMNRRHTANQAITAVKNCQDAGFDNISIDLIYGLPNMIQASWQQNILRAIDLNIQHISSYHLTIEKGTEFYKNLQKGLISEIPEDNSNLQFSTLIEFTEHAGFEHYEISNFALSGYQSKHNSSYWKQIKYLGLGPSAHSYNKLSRRWNISNNQKYIDDIRKGNINREFELLDKNAKYNEYVMTGLRTTWGVDIEYCNSEFGESLTQRFKRIIEVYIKQGNAVIEGRFYKLTKNGFFISDKIISDLFYD